MLEREVHRGADVVVVRGHPVDPPLLVGAVSDGWIGALRECREEVGVLPSQSVGLAVRFELGGGEHASARESAGSAATTLTSPSSSRLRNRLLAPSEPRIVKRPLRNYI